MSATEILILVLASLWAGTIFFWGVIRPYIVETIADEVSRLRSELDWAIIEGRDGSQTRAAIALAESLNGVDLSRIVSLSHVAFVFFLDRRQFQISVAEHAEIFKGSPKWVKDMCERFSYLRMRAMLTNSPTWWIPIAAILLAAFFSGKVARCWGKLNLALANPRLARA